MTEEQERQEPLSRRIADDLRNVIEIGELSPGDRLPSERVLAKRYDAARNTARAAIQIIAEEGLVVAEHGRGVFVRRHTPLFRFGNDRYSPRYRQHELSPLQIEMARQGKVPRFEVLSIERITPGADVAERLKVSPTTKSVLRRENIFWANEDPVHRVTTYIPWTIARGTGLLNDEVGHPYGIHGIFEEKGHTMTRMREEVHARMPRREEAAHLKMPPGVPVLDVLHTSIDQDGEPYELTRFVMRSDATGLAYDMPVE